MTTAALYELHAVRPFRPFRIRLGDRQALPVRHPEMLAYVPGKRTAVVAKPDGSFQIMDLLLVTGLEVSASGNGRKK